MIGNTPTGMQNGDDQREEALTRLKLARDSAKENCGLNSLR